MLNVAYRLKHSEWAVRQGKQHIDTVPFQLITAEITLRYNSLPFKSLLGLTLKTLFLSERSYFRTAYRTN